jgi:hypothetical protein
MQSGYDFILFTQGNKFTISFLKMRQFNADVNRQEQNKLIVNNSLKKEEGVCFSSSSV